MESRVPYSDSLLKLWIESKKLKQRLVFLVAKKLKDITNPYLKLAKAF